MKDLQIATGESCDTYWKIFRKVFVNIGMFRYDMTTKFNLRQAQFSIGAILYHTSNKN